MPLKTDDYWVRRMRSLFANTTLSDEGVVRELKAEAEDGSRHDEPSLRTVNRYRAAWRRLSAEERSVWRSVRWPESMESGDLPWEASATALELLGYYAVVKRRPLVALARWFWRVTLAAPDAPLKIRVETAQALAAIAVAGDSSENDLRKRGMEYHLAFHPWRSKEAGRAYLQALTNGSIPMGPPDFRISAPDGIKGKEFEIAEALTGFTVEPDIEPHVRAALERGIEDE